MNFMKFVYAASNTFQLSTKKVFQPSFLFSNNLNTNFMLSRTCAYLLNLHKRGPFIRKKKMKNPLGWNVPFAKGIVLKTLIKKPKKPNSANRKCVLVRLSSGKEVVAHVPGEGHNLQEHNVVLVRPGRTKDVPGLKIKCVRGKHDLPHVVKSSLR